LRQAVLDAVATLLSNPNPSTRRRGIALAGQLGAGAASLIPLLTTALRDSNRILCRLAAQALCCIGRTAEPALLALLDDHDHYVRDEARWALDHLQRAPRRAPKTQVQRAIDVGTAADVRTKVVSISPAHSHERRCEARFPCTRSTICRELTVPALDVWWPAKICDVSTAGISLVVARQTIPGVRLAINLVEADVRVHRRPLGRVMHCRQIEKNWFLGCKFIGPLTPQEVDRLCESSMS
jgi:hypothetical protein